MDLLYSEVLLSLGLDVLPIHLCDECIASGNDFDYDEISTELIVECVSNAKNLFSDANFNDSSVDESNNHTRGMSMKRIAAGTLCLLHISNCGNDILSSGCILLKLCSDPGASAFGVLNNHVLSSIINGLLKVTLYEIKQSQIKTKNGAVSRGVKSKRKPKSAMNGNNDEGHDGDGIDEEEHSPSQDFGLTQSQGFSQSEPPNSQGTVLSQLQQHSIQSSASFAIFRDIFKELSSFLYLFTERGDPHLIDTLSECLISVLCLGELTEGFTESSKIASALLIRLCEESLVSDKGIHSVTSVFRSLLPVLGMSSHNSRVPDNSKAKVACHKGIIQFLVSLATHERLATTVHIPDNDHHRRDTMKCSAREQYCPDNNNMMENSEEWGTIPSGSMSSSSSSPVLTCIINSVQRLVMSAPDRAPVRALISTSILQILHSVISTETTITTSTTTIRATGTAQIKTTKTSSSSSLPSSALIRSEAFVVCLHFLMKVSRATKIGLRAFALDIIASLLGTDWFWDIEGLAIGGNNNNNYNHDNDNHHNKEEGRVDSGLKPTVYSQVFEVVEGRLLDIAPTVRARALGLLCDLLEIATGAAGNRNVPVQLIALLRSRIESSTVNDPDTVNDSSHIGILDLLSERVQDDKAIVRGKALQAIGLLVTLQASDSSNRSLVSERIISVIADRCSDDSMSVRRQAMISLSDLLLARSSDTLLQEAWVMSVLPLSLDPEAAVQLRLSQVVFTLLVEAALHWNLRNARESSSGHNDNTPNPSVLGLGLGLGLRCDPVWTICGLISRTGRTNMLRSCFGTMIKNGILRSTGPGTGLGLGLSPSSTPDASSIEGLTIAIRSACSVTDNENDNMNQDNMYGREESSGAWVLLEALLVQDELKGHLGDSSDAATFVVRSFFQSLSEAKSMSGPGSGFGLIRGSGSGVENVVVVVGEGNRPVTSLREAIYPNTEIATVSPISDNGIRMLKILQKLSKNISPGDSERITSVLTDILLDLKVGNDAAAAAVSLLFALASRSSDNEETVLDRKCIAHWSQPLLIVLKAVLQHFVWSSLPDDFLQYPENLRIKISSLCGFDKESNGCGSGEGNGEGCDSDKSSRRRGRRSSCSSYFTTSDGVNMNSDAVKVVCNALFLLGELAMLGYSVDADDENLMMTTAATASSTIAADVPLRGYLMDIPTPIITLVQLLMGQRLPAQTKPEMFDVNTAAPCGHATFGDISRISMDGMTLEDAMIGVSFGGSLCPPAIRAFAFIAMGKLCLRNRNRAKDHISVFLRELCSDEWRNLKPVSGGSGVVTMSASWTSNSAVRSNSLLILGDLCVRYTNLVDRHIGTMAACLQDSSPMVRRHAFVLLSQLLLQDYLKWRGMLLFRFLAVIVDPDAELSLFAQNGLRKTVLAKFPGIFCQHVIEAIVVFNNCAGHAAYSAVASAGSEGGSDVLVGMDGVQLAGIRSRSLRFRVYEFMVEGLTEEQKISTCAKIVQEVFTFALDQFNLHDTAATTAADKPSARRKTQIDTVCLEEMLQDGFSLLQSPLLKISTRGDKDTSQEDIEDTVDVTDGSGASSVGDHHSLLAKAKAKVLKKLSLQHLVGHILPVVCSLKHALEAHRSSLQRVLMEYLMSLMRTHKNEVAETLSADPVLKAEIEYDLKVFERETARASSAAQVTSNAARVLVDQDGKRRASDGCCTSPPRTRARLSSIGSVTIAPSLKKSVRRDSTGGRAMLPSEPRIDKGITDHVSTTNKQSLMSGVRQVLFSEVDMDTARDMAQRLTDQRSSRQSSPCGDRDGNRLSQKLLSVSISVPVSVPANENRNSILANLHVVGRNRVMEGDVMKISNANANANNHSDNSAVEKAFGTRKRRGHLTGDSLSNL
eukprot:gene2902-5693_t